MAIGDVWACTPVNISASGLVRPGPGAVVNILVNSSTSGTLTLWDNTSATGTKITNATVLTAGSTLSLYATFNTGLFATIGGTADITIMYVPA
jgi:ABC-type nitrate/sulfonate/bicarbonate transport system permease component